MAWNDGRIDGYLGSDAHKENVDKARQLAKQKQCELKQERVAAYNKNPTKCLFCETPISYEDNIKKKKYCNSSCAAKYNNMRRTQSDSTKQKISQALKALKEPKEPKEPKSPPKGCLMCGSEFIPKQRQEQKFCSRACSEQNKASPEWRTRLSERVKERVANGTHKGWASRFKLKPSYPEQYFINLFNNEGIEYQREVKCGKFFIDFVVGKYAIEIDGKQHTYPEHVERDKRKDEYLKEQGYDVVRIAWANPSSPKGREVLYPQIEHMKMLLDQ